MPSWKRSLLLAAVVVPLALAARWNGSIAPKGGRFYPWPDAVEYAAEAQSLARSGQVYLQIGPHRVRPRYPPGWPLLLAPAVRLGVPGQELWRITALFGAALALLLAEAAARTTAALTGSRAAPLAAGWLAGTVWALTPIAVDLGQTTLSDEPAALAALAALALSGAALLRQGGRRPWLLAAAGGAAFGLAASMRAVVAALLVPPLALVLAGGVQRLGGREALRRSAAWALGAAVLPAITVWIMIRSGWPAWQWSGYSFWVPQRYDRLADTFNLRFALSPDPSFRQEINGRPLSHLDLAGRVLLGLPGLRVHHYLGLIWPIAGWLAAVPLWRAARRQGIETGEIARWVAPALLLWTLAHLAVFSLYFYPSSRFYLAPLALCTVLFAAGCGLGLARTERPRRLASMGAAVLVVALTARSFAQLRSQPPPATPVERTRSKFTRWLALGDERRSHRAMLFDPVHAQALGLLTPEVAAGVREWGKLPDTVHVRRLRANGFLPREGAPAAVR
jgi:4-amino-4-deoxy-L-arabinose transferase-like glycosyltransferase